MISLREVVAGPLRADGVAGGAGGAGESAVRRAAATAAVALTLDAA